MTIPQSVGNRKLSDLPPTPFELDQERHRLVIEDNNVRERYRVREANAEKGWDEPKPGEVIYVQLDGTLVHRNRSGLRFERNQRIAVVVIEGTEQQVRAKQQAGYTERGMQVVSIYGADLIIQDTSLHKYKGPMAPDDIDSLKRDNAAKDEALRLAQEQLRQLQAQMSEARRGAAPSRDGRPSKLNAQAAAAAAAGTTPGAVASKSAELGLTEGEEPEFGGAPPTPDAPTK